MPTSSKLLQSRGSPLLHVPLGQSSWAEIEDTRQQAVATIAILGCVRPQQLSCQQVRGSCPQLPVRAQEALDTALQEGLW